MISIIIPSFNKDKYLSLTLDSLTDQTYQKWEALIVDDGSTDNSIGIIEAYCRADKRFRLIKRTSQNKGGSVCRNIGLRHAHGTYCIFLDADDILTPHCLKNRLKQFELWPDCHFLVSSGGTFYHKVGDSQSKWIPESDANHLKQFISHTLPWQTSAPIWCTSYIKDIGGFDETYPRLQDVEFHTRALLQSGVSYKIIGGEPDYYYRIDEERKLNAPHQLVETFIKAVELYTSKMKAFIEKRKDKVQLLKALNGTYQAAYLTAQVQYDLGNITVDERKQLFEQIIRFHHTKGLFKLYIKGLRLGIHKLKGYNWLMKKLLTT